MIGLVLLLILTIIGVTALRTSTQQEKMAAANQQSTQTFQAAESAIRQIMGQLQPGASSPTNGGTAMLLAAINNAFAPPPVIAITQSYTADTGMTSTAALSLTCTTSVQGYSQNIGAGNAVTNYVFAVVGTASQDGTGAVAQHNQGVAYLGPAGSSLPCP